MSCGSDDHYHRALEGGPPVHADPTPNVLELDAVIVGAGFAGVYLLHQLRKEGLKVKILEAGHGLGGVWHWSSYPGARVDSPYPTYALNIPEVYNTWTWTEEYPGEKELKRYFQHVDKVLDISKDVLFGTMVTTATFNDHDNNWMLKSDTGSTVVARFFCSCIGFAAKKYIPNWPGLDDIYQGQVVHSSYWPAEGIDVRGKRVAVIGSGATGVQIAQELARHAKDLTCFVRTPNLTWPMGQKAIDRVRATQDLSDDASPTMEYLLSQKRFTTVGGFIFPETTRKVLDDTEQEREARLEEDYQAGGYRVFFSSYIDIMIDKAGNDEIYKFWKRKTRARMVDQHKAKLLAPDEAPHPFAGKRPSLEQDYYEQMDKPHVKLVDAKNNSITHLVHNGIVTSDGIVHEADIIAMATGFDAVTGGFMNMAITGCDGLTLNQKWEDETLAYLGMTISGFPNLFYTYGPLAVTAFGNGPSVVESQADWIVEVIRRMREEGYQRIDATKEAETQWKQKVVAIHAVSLANDVEGSWYLGLNIPGKKREPLNFAGGLPLYRRELHDSIVPQWKGFLLSHSS